MAEATLRWYLSREGRSEGPLEEAEVLERIASGVLGASAFAAPEGASEWRSLDAHPPFARALSAGATRRDLAPTIVGARAPASPPGVLLSVSGGSAPGILAVPIAGAKPRRGPKIAAGCGVVLVLLVAAAGLFWLYEGREPAPLPLVIESAEVEDVDREAVDAFDLVEEMVRVRVRTEPGARVSVSSSPEVEADADGAATVLYPFQRTREPTVEIEVRTTVREDGRARDGRQRVTVERPARIFVRGSVAECSTRSCALGVETDGALTMSGIDATARITLGQSTAVGEAPDPSEELLAALDPTALFGDESYTVPLPLRIELGDGARFDGVYPVNAWTLRRVLFGRFATAAQGAVEVPAEGRGRTILWLDGTAGDPIAPDMRLIGAAATVGDIGRVAIVTAAPRRRSCGRYGRGSDARAVFVERRHARIVVYDRRRGRVSRRRTLNAPAIACPRNITVEPGVGDIDAGRSEVDPDAIAAWLRSI